MSVVAIVPVRAGSQRVPKKGFRPFGDTTLIDLKLSTLTQVNKIDEIIVTTDSEEVLEIAKGTESRNTSETLTMHHQSALVVKYLNTLQL